MKVAFGVRHECRSNSKKCGVYVCMFVSDAAAGEEGMTVLEQDRKYTPSKAHCEQ